VGIAPIFGPDDANRFTNQRLATGINSPAYLTWPVLRTRRMKTTPA
jgi:hypothetical protein